MKNPLAKPQPVALRQLMDGLERADGAAGVAQRIAEQLKARRDARRVGNTFGMGGVITSGVITLTSSTAMWPITGTAGVGWQATHTVVSTG